MGKRIPLHDHTDHNSGGPVTANATGVVTSSGGGGGGSASGGTTAGSASAVAIADTGGLYAATDVEAALAEVATGAAAHLGDTTDAHDASAVSFAPGGTIAATDAQGAIAEVATDAASALSSHASAADPHTGYQRESEKGAANGYASLGAGGLVPIAQIASGTPDGTKFVRDDGTLVTPTATVATLDAVGDVNAPAPANGYVLTWDSTPGEWIAQAAPGAGGGDSSGQFVAIFDGGGAAPAAGAIVDIVAPYTGTLTDWEMLGDVSGSAEIKVGKDVAANFPPTFPADLITASAPPTVTTAARAASSTLTGWTTAVTAGDVLRFYLVSASTLGRVTCVLHYSRP